MRRSEAITPECARIRDIIVTDRRELTHLRTQRSMLRPTVDRLENELEDLERTIRTVQSVRLPYTVSRTWLGIAIELITEGTRDRVLDRLAARKNAKESELRDPKSKLSRVEARIDSLQANLQQQTARFRGLRCDPGALGMWTVG
jgi:chromosome segregation ATPase